MNRAETNHPFEWELFFITCLLLQWELLQSRAVETHSWMSEKSANGVKHDNMTESMSTFRPLENLTTI